MTTNTPTPQSKRLVFVISPPRAGSTLLQRMLGSHSQIATYPEPHLITPLVYLGYFDTVDKSPYDHINAAEAMRTFVSGLPHGEADYLDALRAYADTLYGRMLDKLGGQTYFLDKTPAYALNLDFLTKLYPQAKFIVLTRHPMAVMSSYADSFFEGNWQTARAYNPIIERYVPAIAKLLRDRPVHCHHVSYETLVKQPEHELSRIFDYLELEDQPDAVNYGDNYQGETTQGRGDPIGVQQHNRPVTDSIARWAKQLNQNPDNKKVAHTIIENLSTQDLNMWGYSADEMLQQMSRTANTTEIATQHPRFNKHRIQRKVLLALKKDIHERPLGKVVKRVKYYCDVILRE